MMIGIKLRGSETFLHFSWPFISPRAGDDRAKIRRELSPWQETPLLIENSSLRKKKKIYFNINERITWIN